MKGIITEKDLGDKIHTTQAGKISIKFYEYGIALRKQKQGVLILNNEEVRFFCEMIKIDLQDKNILRNLKEEQLNSEEAIFK